MSPITTKIAELRAFAKEYEHYSSKMPSDPYARRWQIIADALSFQADSLENDERRHTTNTCSSNHPHNPKILKEE